MQELFNIARETGIFTPFKAVAILVVGVAVALAVFVIVRAALRRTEIDNRLARWFLGDARARTLEVEQAVAKGIFYLILVIFLGWSFQELGFTLITEPLIRFLTKLSDVAPQLIGAAALLLFAWVVATVLKLTLMRVLSAAKLDKHLATSAGFEEEGRAPVSQTLSNAAYWLVFLLFLPGVLSVLSGLGLQGLLDPVQGMMNKVFGFLPNVFYAGVILVGGWLIARILQRIVTNLTAAAGADRLSEQAGLATVLGKHRLSDLLGLILYVLVLIPVLIAALDKLRLAAITQPATNMLNRIWVALPNIFAAVLLLLVSYWIGRVVAGWITNLLEALGFNAILRQLGLGKEPAKGERTPSEIAGSLILVAVVLFASVEAFQLLGFSLVADLVYQFLVAAGQVLVGLLVFAIGLYLASVAAQAVLASGTTQASLLALATRVSIIALAGAMALRQMDLANEIINLAFGLLLGAVAVAMALAFGLGGRDIAARELEAWLKSIKSKKS